MKKSRFTGCRIFSILKEDETAIKTADICRRLAITESRDIAHNRKARSGWCFVLLIKWVKELNYDLL